MDRGVHAALDNWLRAMRSANPRRVAACYAPHISRYYNLREASTADVRREVSRSLARYGRPTVLRISNVSIVPDGSSRAIATFRWHWQTAGKHPNAGEEDQRLAFVNTGGRWRIASQEETKIYWTQKP
jgi:hypothetical protein